MRQGQYGASLLEVMLVVALVLVFILLASERILQLRQTAEQVGVEHTIGTLRSALGSQMAATVVQQGMAGLLALDGSNPMELLEQLPVNYLGARDQAPEPHPPGSWYFDRAQQELIYRARYPARLYISDAPQSEQIRLRLRVYYAAATDTEEGPVQSVQRVVIEPVHPYVWLGE